MARQAALSAVCSNRGEEDVALHNDSAIINETLRDYCLETGVEFTRCRPYRKNDQAWVGQ